MSDKIIGKQIRKARIARQLSQKELGKEIGVTWEMISRYENGKSSARRNLEKLSKTLNRPIQYFFGVEDIPLREEMERLSRLIDKKKRVIEGNNKVKYIEVLAGLKLEEALQLSSAEYFCPKWIIKKYNDAFAMRLDNVDSDVLSITASDIGYFSYRTKPEKRDYVLIGDISSYEIVRYKKGRDMEPEAILIAIEKRYKS